MNSENYLKDIYRDFFGDTNTNITVEEVNDINFDEEINKLFLDEESKSLFKKIINYIITFSDDKRYIPFNISLIRLTNKTLDNIIKILASAVKKSNYLSNINVGEISMFKLNEDIFKKQYESNNIIILKDINGIELESINDKQKYMYLLEESINDNKNITLLCVNNEDELNNIFTYNSNLKDKHFVFKLKEIKEEKSIVYNDILENTNLSEDNKVKLMDYISSTYDKTNLDLETYKNNIINYIILNNDIPLIKEEKTIDEIFKELNELVGLSKVKKTLYELVDLIKLKEKTNDKLKIGNVNLHMIFLGNPGTGKTTIARLLSGIFYNLGLIKENKLIEVTSKDLIAEYVGQTAIKTNEVINKALGGLLFIDEAYMLGDKNNSYNSDAIGTLIAQMENNRDNLVVIFAGYTKEMQSFLNANSGIASRIGYTLEFDDYTCDELIKIFDGMMKKAGFEVLEEAHDELKNIILENINKENFGNARFIRNIYEKTIIRHASNTKNNKSKKILMTITRKDINDDNLL